MKLGNKGFTLVETMITMSILAIVITISALMILSSTNIVTNNSRIDTEKFIGDSICNWIEERTKYATGVSITPNNGSLSIDDKRFENAFCVDDGKFVYSSSANPYFNLYGDDFYFNHTIRYSTSCKSITENRKTIELLTITVDVFKSDDKINPAYTASAEVKLMNMGLNVNYTSDTAKGSFNPIVSFSNASNVAGSADDPAVNELMIRSDLMREQFDLWLQQYNASGKNPQVAADFERAFYLSTGKKFNLQDTQYYDYLNTRLGGKWLQFNNELLKPLNTGSTSSYYNYLLKNQLLVRVYYPDVQNGRIENEAFYYAINTINEPWGALLVYNLRDQSWYYYNKPATIGFKKYDLSHMYRPEYTVDWLYDQIEGADSGWHKLKK